MSETKSCVSAKQNTTIMKPRNLMFWLLAVAAVPGRFLSLFYQAHGQTASQIGILFSAQTLVTLPSTPYFSHIADRRSKDVVVLLLQSSATAIFLLQIPLLPAAHIVPHAIVFPLLLVISIAFGICISPLQPIVNGIAMEHLQKAHGSNGRILFGRERLWGAIGWALASLLAGILFDIRSVGVKGIYILHVTLALIFCTVLFRSFRDRYNASWSRTGDRCHFREIDADEVSSTSLVTALRTVFNRGETVDVLFFNVVFWMAVAIAAVENLLFVYLVSSIGMSNTLCGFTIILTVMFEIPVYFLAPDILKQLSTGSVFVVGAFALLIRMVGYSFATNGWQILLVEPLHGMTFASADAAAVAFVAANAPGGAHAVAQSAIFVVRAVGMAVGSVVGGVVLEWFGARALYLSIATIVLTVTILFAFTENMTRRRSLRPPPQLCPLSTPVSNVGQVDERTMLVCRVQAGTLGP